MKIYQDWQEKLTDCKLREGYHLFAMPGNSWLLHTPEAKFIRLHLSEGQGSLLAALFNGTSSVEAALEQDATIIKVLDLFTKQNLLLNSNDQATAPCRQKIVLTGDNPLAERVVELFEQNENIVIERRNEATIAFPQTDFDLLLSCAGWLPDKNWQKLDKWCEAHKIPWQRCDLEGRQFCLGPFYLPGLTAGYNDVRARRLAASPYPEELLAYWSYLSEDKVPLVNWPRPEILSIVAGTLVSSVMAHFSQMEIAGLGQQLIFDPVKLSWEQYAILPLPDNIKASVSQ